MAFLFDQSIISAVLHHMNTDHPADNLLIVRAFGAQDATAAEMVTFDGEGGEWKATSPSGDSNIRITWLDGPIDDRPAIRREVVALYDEACARLGVEPRPH